MGLALSYALSVTNLLSGLISSFTLTETMMVSVERTEEYTTDIPTEPQDKLVQVKAQTCSQGLAHLLALCPALASWGHSLELCDPVNGWRALTHRNHLDHSSFTSTFPRGMNIWQELVKARMMERGRRAERLLGPSCERKTSLGGSGDGAGLCIGSAQKPGNHPKGWMELGLWGGEAEDDSGSRSYSVSPWYPS